MRKINNFRGRFAFSVVSSPDFASPQTPTAAKIDSSLINGKHVVLTQKLVLWKGDQIFIDNRITRLTPTSSVSGGEKWWSDGENSWWLPEQPNGDNPIATNLETPVPATIFDPLQIAGPQASNLNFRPYALKRYGARIVGKEQFDGLDCLRVEYDFAPKGRDESVRGYTLICPERDYKEVFREHHLSTGEKTGVREVITKRTVRQFTKFQGMWLPSASSFEWQDVFADGQVRLSRLEEFRIVELQIGAVENESALAPLWSPGTLIYRSGVEDVEVAGGDLSNLEEQLQDGKFEALDTWQIPQPQSFTQKSNAVTGAANALPRAEDDPTNEIALAKPTVKVGDVAPDFTVSDMNGKTWKLSELKGKKNLLLTFFPKCFTGGCANHLSSLRDKQKEFDALDTQILAVSVDSADGDKGQKAFAAQWQLGFPLVPDSSRSLSKLFGAAQTDKQLAARMSVFIDKTGIVRWVDANVNVASHGADALARIKAET